MRQSERRRAPPRGGGRAGRSASSGVTLLRDDGSPTYHLASVVDDLDFEITHVLRGTDHRPNEELHRALCTGARARAAGVHPPRAGARRRREEALEARARARPSPVAARGRHPGRGGARVSRGARPAGARRAPRPRAADPLASRSTRSRRSPTRSSPRGSASDLGRPARCAARTTSSRRASLRRSILEPPARVAARGARPRRSTRFAELLAATRPRQGREGDRARAEGGRRQPAGAAARADRARRGPELWAVLAALPRDEALRRVDAAL